jgi:hypothetical protein
MRKTTIAAVSPEIPRALIEMYTLPLNVYGDILFHNKSLLPKWGDPDNKHSIVHTFGLDRGKEYWTKDVWAKAIYSLKTKYPTELLVGLNKLLETSNDIKLYKMLNDLTTLEQYKNKCDGSAKLITDIFKEPTLSAIKLAIKLLWAKFFI